MEMEIAGTVLTTVAESRLYGTSAVTIPVVNAHGLYIRELCSR
jgi:hypothetical protein